MTRIRFEKRRSFALIMCIIGAGCAGSDRPLPSTFPPAYQPSGVPAFLYLSGDSIHGEVLTVEAEALILLVHASSPAGLSGKLARIPFHAITLAEFMYAGSSQDRRRPHAFMVTEGSRIASDPAIRGRLRFLARYPQGASPDLLARLQEAYGAIEVLEPVGIR